MAKTNWSCDECGEILPADQFVQVTDQEVARTSRSTRVYKGTRGGLGVGGGSSRSFRHVKKKLCPECVAVRNELARRARARLLTMWLIGGGAALLLIIILASQPPSRSVPAAVSTVAADNSQVGDFAEPTPDATPADEASPVSDASPLPAEAKEEDKADVAPFSPEQDAPASPQRFAGDSDQAMKDAIQEAAPRALESGEAVSWSAGDRHGYVVVSAPQQRGAKVCRNAYWTIITANNQIQGPSDQWCKADGGAWVKRD